MTIIKRILRRREMGVFIPLLILWLVTFLVNNAFLSRMNIVNLLRSISVTLLGSIGVTFVFSCGMMDLSIGSIYGLSGIIAGLCMIRLGFPVWLAILAGTLVAAIFGLINGIIINTLDLPAFVTTLGTSYIARGMINVISEGKTVTGFPDAFVALGGVGLFGLPWSVYIALVFAVIAGFVLKYTVYGRSLLAVGGNSETARTCGINIKRVRNIAFIIAAGLCGFAGILSVARLGTAQPTAGTGWEMTIIAATIIGGVSMYGGSSSILGAAIGVAIMETLTISMTMMRVNAYWQRVVVGVIIVIAVGIDTIRQKKMSGGKG